MFSGGSQFAFIGVFGAGGAAAAGVAIVVGWRGPDPAAPRMPWPPAASSSTRVSLRSAATAAILRAVGM